MKKLMHKGWLERVGNFLAKLPRRRYNPQKSGRVEVVPREWTERLNSLPKQIPKPRPDIKLGEHLL